jgi:hypothetical protein
MYADAIRVTGCEFRVAGRALGHGYTQIYTDEPTMRKMEYRNGFRFETELIFTGKKIGPAEHTKIL